MQLMSSTHQHKLLALRRNKYDPDITEYWVDHRTHGKKVQKNGMDSLTGPTQKALLRGPISTQTQLMIGTSAVPVFALWKLVRM